MRATKHPHPPRPGFTDSDEIKTVLFGAVLAICAIAGPLLFLWGLFVFVRFLLRG